MEKISVDADIIPYACPVSGKECPALRHLTDLYTEGVDSSVEADLPSFMRSDHNERKLAIKRLELVAIARLSSCSGATENQVCPTRQIMDNNKLRQTAVKGIRSLLSF